MNLQHFIFITYKGTDTKVFEYENKLIMPAFIDTHQHYVDGAINNSEHLCTDIAYSKSEADCVRILKIVEEWPSFKPDFHSFYVIVFVIVVLNTRIRRRVSGS